MGFPGTFARLKSRLRQISENQVRYGPKLDMDPIHLYIYYILYLRTPSFSTPSL
jgi:hypothetical protein